MEKTQSVPADIAPIESRLGNKKRVHQFGADGKFIKTYDSIVEAQKALGIKGVGIYRAVHGTSKSCHGFQFRLAE
jgi:PII-like signaling protein